MVDIYYICFYGLEIGNDLINFEYLIVLFVLFEFIIL